MRLLEVQAKHTFPGSFKKVLINPSAIGHVAFPDYLDSSHPNTKYVRLGLGSSAEYIITLDTWNKIVALVPIDIEVA